MNPFELPGPDFLIFFALLGTVVLLGMVWLRRALEPDPTVLVQLTEPYDIAYLRGGGNEVLRLATTGLIDRGLLTAEGTKLRVGKVKQARLVNDPMEKGILEHFQTEKEIKTLFARGDLMHEGERYKMRLREQGLIADIGARFQQLVICVGAIAVIWITAMTKIGMARQRGYPYGFLVLLTIAFTVGAFVLGFSRRTQRGKRFLKDMRALFEPLRQRSENFTQRVSTSEVLLLAAVFGVGALPNSIYPYAHQLFAKAVKAGGDGGWGSSCGSSCGSSGSSGDSSGSSCGSSGSSCGGGGCGGGCGGCGS